MIGGFVVKRASMKRRVKRSSSKSGARGMSARNKKVKRLLGGKRRSARRSAKRRGSRSR